MIVTVIAYVCWRGRACSSQIPKFWLLMHNTGVGMYVDTSQVWVCRLKHTVLCVQRLTSHVINMHWEVLISSLPYVVLI